VTCWTWNDYLVQATHVTEEPNAITTWMTTIVNVHLVVREKTATLLRNLLSIHVKQILVDRMEFASLQVRLFTDDLNRNSIIFIFAIEKQMVIGVFVMMEKTGLVVMNYLMRLLRIHCVDQTAA